METVRISNLSVATQVLSWAVAVPLSVPLGKLLTDAIANAIDLQLTYEYSMLGALLWLIVVVVLSALASGLPAWRAAQLSVEDVLAYE